MSKFLKSILTACFFLKCSTALYAENTNKDSNLCLVANSALTIASKVRGLKTLNKVPCQVESKDTIRKFIVERISEEYGNERLEIEGQRFKSLKLIPKNSNYHKLITDLYESQVAGYYDNIAKRFVMASWLAASTQLPVAVHEQSHALQDQHFNLTNFLDYKKLTSDELLARSALVEGDASLVMYEQMLTSLGQPSLKNQANVNLYIMQNVVATGLLAKDKPEIANISQIMIFPYSAGLHFVHALLKKGGFAEIDKAYKNPPKSTSQILHPERYLNGEPEKVDFEKLKEKARSLIGSDEELVEADSLGEFVFSLFLKNLGVPAFEANKIAEGLRGDVLFLRGDRKGGGVWYLEFGESEDQSRFIENCKAVLIRKDMTTNILNSKGIVLIFKIEKKKPEK